MKSLTKRIDINIGNRLSKKIYNRVSIEVFQQISHQVQRSIEALLFDQICIHIINEITNEKLN